MRIFKDLDLVEQLGSGIPRILEVYDKDSFHFSENFLRVVYPKNIIETGDSNQDYTTSGHQQCFLTQKREITLLMSSILFHLFDTYSKKCPVYYIKNWTN